MSPTDIFSLFRELILVYFVYFVFRMYIKKLDRRLEEMKKEVVEMERKERSQEKMNDELRIENRRLKEERDRERNEKNHSIKKAKDLSEQLEKMETREKNGAKELRALQLKNRKMTEELRMEKTAKDHLIKKAANVSEQLQLKDRKMTEKLRMEKTAKENLIKKASNLSEQLEKVETREKNGAKELRALQLKNRKMTEELRMEKKAKDHLLQQVADFKKMETNEERNRSKGDSFPIRGGSNEIRKASVSHPKHHYLSRLSMECIIGFLDVNKRLQLSLSADPVLKRMEKSVPMHLQYLKITKKSLTVNETEYSFICPRKMIRRFESYTEPEPPSPVYMFEDTHQNEESIRLAVKNFIREFFGGRARYLIDLYSIEKSVISGVT